MMKAFNVMTIGLCVLASVVSCGQQQGAQQQQARPSVYPLLTLAPENRTLTVSHPAVVEGKQYVEVRPQVSGIVTKVLVKEGADVKKGQTLFVIDTIPYAAAYQTAKANVAAAAAQEATAKLNLEGSKELHSQKVISDFELQTAQNTYNTAAAALAQAKSQEINAANNLSFTKVKSPVSGSAGMTSIRVGTLVSAGSVSLINVSDNSQMYVYFSLPEKEVLSLTKEYGSIRNTINSYAEVSLLLSDGTTYEKPGKIDVISGIVDKNTGSVRLRAVFDNAEGRLMSGSAANILIPYSRENCIVIPQKATFEVQDRVYAYKVVDGKTAAAQIKVFKINDGKEYIVEEGLQEGDVIIAEGAGLVREGTPVATSSASDK